MHSHEHFPPKHLLRLMYAIASLRCSALFLLLAFALLCDLPAAAQPSPPPVTGEAGRWYGSTGKSRPYDTAALKEAQERTIESAGLLERPIDPAAYRLGPNDILHVTIWTQQTRQFEAIVTPDAKLLIPTVGQVDVRGLTLSDAETRVRSAVAKEYRVDASLSLAKMREFKVSVIGAVFQGGTVLATPATRVSEAIDLVGGALQRADRRNVLVYRLTGKGEAQEVIRVDLLPYFVKGDLSANPLLHDGDVVRVNLADPANIVQIYGEVNAFGEYTWQEGDSISTLIEAAFGPTVQADRDSIEVVSVNDQGEIVSRTYHRLLPDGSVTDDRELQIADRVFVRPKPQFRQLHQVVLKGEVQRPGVYPIMPGVTRLRTIIESAGGFTDRASVIDASLIRRQAMDQDDEYFAYVNAIEPENRTPDESEYFRIKLLENRKLGYMTIDFPALMNGDDSQNLLLINDDSLYVPQMVNYIRVSGKVKTPGNFLYAPSLTYGDYIARAGGYGWEADKGETQVIKGRTGDRLPAEDEDEYILEPGDAIFVPEEKPGNFWSGFTTAITIVANVAAIIAVVVSLTPDNSSNGN